MARITMKTQQSSSIEQSFSLFLTAASSRGVKDKTLETYRQHFRAISKRLDNSRAVEDLSKDDLDGMIAAMRKDELSERSINSYTRTFKVFLSWCNEEGYSSATISIYKASEAVKETYTDAELLELLKKPRAGVALRFLSSISTSCKYAAGTFYHIVSKKEIICLNIVNTYDIL